MHLALSLTRAPYTPHIYLYGMNASFDKISTDDS